MTFTDEFENALMSQKADIISTINEGICDSANYIKAAQLLAFSRRLWVSVGYGYKFHELETRLRQSIVDEIDGSAHHATEKKFREVLATANKILGER